jgi:tetratricopeptide (TPR) repeat protein
LSGLYVEVFIIIGFSSISMNGIRFFSNVLKTVFLASIAASVQADYVDDALAPVFHAAEARDFPGAFEHLETLSSETDDPRPHFHLARLQLRAGLVEDAESTIEALVEKYPDFVDAHYLNGLVQLAMVGEVSIFKKLGKAKHALNAWQRTTELDPAHKDAHYAIFAWYASAPGIAGGDLEEAQRLQVILAQMDQGYGALALGLLLSRQEAFAEAEAQFIEATQLMDRAGPHFTLAQFYLQQENWRGALEQIAEYEDKEKRWWDPDRPVVHLVRASAHAKLGDTELAREEAESGLALGPNKRVKALLKEILNEL